MWLLCLSLVLGAAVVEGPILVSKKRAAELLDVSVRTISNLLAARQLRPRKIGRRTLVSYRELMQFSRRDHESPVPDLKRQAAGDRNTE
jgi:excisionase family DNA binding protein